MSTSPDLELAATAAMLQAHESAKVVDQDAVAELQTKLEVGFAAWGPCVCVTTSIPTDFDTHCRRLRKPEPTMQLLCILHLTTGAGWPQPLLCAAISTQQAPPSVQQAQCFVRMSARLTHAPPGCSLTKSKERARGLVERVLRMQPDYGPAQVLLGWIILGQQADEEYGALVDDSELEEAAASFEAALSSDPNDLEVRQG